MKPRTENSESTVASSNPQTIGGVEKLITDLRGEADILPQEVFVFLNPMLLKAASTIEHQLSVIGELQRALKALQLQALQSTVNSPSNEWGREALELTRKALALPASSVQASAGQETRCASCGTVTKTRECDCTNVERPELQNLEPYSASIPAPVVRRVEWDDVPKEAVNQVQRNIHSMFGKNVENCQAHSLALEVLREYPLALLPAGTGDAEAGWQDISTAPKDTAILTYGFGYEVAHYNTKLNKWVSCWDHRPIDPKLWQRLPAMPTRDEIIPPADREGK